MNNAKAEVDPCPDCGHPLRTVFVTKCDCGYVRVRMTEEMAADGVVLTVNGTDYRDEFERAWDAHCDGVIRRISEEIDRTAFMPKTEPLHLFESADIPHVVQD